MQTKRLRRPDALFPEGAAYETNGEISGYFSAVPWFTVADVGADLGFSMMVPNGANAAGVNGETGIDIEAAGEDLY